MRTIKTQEDLDNVLNSWYSRTIRLRDIADNPNESVERAKRATLLYWQMIQKTTSIFINSIRVNQPKNCNFEKGTKTK